MSHGSTAALTPAQSAPLSLVARVVRIGLRMVAKPVLRANLSVEAARWQLRLANRRIPTPPRATETTVIDAGGVPAERVTTAASRHDRHIIYLHGGGYVAGWAGLCRDLTWRLATLCRVCVLGVNYRLPPPPPFSAAPAPAAARPRLRVFPRARPRRSTPGGGGIEGGAVWLSPPCWGCATKAPNCRRPPPWSRRGPISPLPAHHCTSMPSSIR